MLEFELPGSVPAPEGGIEDASPSSGALRLMPKRTWQPNRLKRKRKHGFLKCVSALLLCAFFFSANAIPRS